MSACGFCSGYIDYIYNIEKIFNNILYIIYLIYFDIFIGIYVIKSLILKVMFLMIVNFYANENIVWASCGMFYIHPSRRQKNVTFTFSLREGKTRWTLSFLHTAIWALGVDAGLITWTKFRISCTFIYIWFQMTWEGNLQGYSISKSYTRKGGENVLTTWLSCCFLLKATIMFVLFLGGEGKHSATLFTTIIGTIIF